MNPIKSMIHQLMGKLLQTKQFQALTHTTLLGHSFCEKKYVVLLIAFPLTRYLGMTFADNSPDSVIKLFNSSDRSIVRVPTSYYDAASQLSLNLQNNVIRFFRTH